MGYNCILVNTFEDIQYYEDEIVYVKQIKSKKIFHISGKHNNKLDLNTLLDQFIENNPKLDIFSINISSQQSTGWYFDLFCAGKIDDKMAENH